MGLRDKKQVSLEGSTLQTSLEHQRANKKLPWRRGFSRPLWTTRGFFYFYPLFCNFYHLPTGRLYSLWGGDELWKRRMIRSIVGVDRSELTPVERFQIS